MIPDVQNKDSCCNNECRKSSAKHTIYGEAYGEKEETFIRSAKFPD